MLKLPEESKYRVQTMDGPVCGLIEKVKNRTYYRFKKIPYAKPPLGLLRFVPPVPIKPWIEELDCTQDSMTAARYWAQEKFVLEEDCLYIDICAPKNTSNKLLPILFFLGSYRFFYHMDPILDPKLMVNQEVIFVRCGFRLGPFGFLSINEFVAPGNNGLKDIVVALQWVQRNIKCFGGDPNNITIFGCSSGGSLVHYMMLSPMATGLFHKAIIQSASAMNNWSLEKNPIQPVLKLAKILGIAHTDVIEIVKELQKIPSKNIMEASEQLLTGGDFEDRPFDSLFKPCIEKEFEGIPIFLSKSPALILKSGKINKVPLIIGANSCEASFLEYVDNAFYENYEKINEHFSPMVPKSLADRTFSKKVGQKILNFYLDGEESLREDTKQQYVQIMSDYNFFYNINKTIKIHKQIAPESPIYYYVINYPGEWKVPKTLEFFNSSGHAAETPFLFEVTLDDGSVCKGSRDSMRIKYRIIKLWTNFAKFGNPTPDKNDPLLKITWDPVTSKDELNYLCINPNLTKGVNPFHDRMCFWDELHKEHKFLQIIAHFSDIGIL
ncbi:esterase FE4-like [Battus philenor]|uniref:esterase FE4-like n=1 Tax=Battus philenor TaxID=42288 RepID=UPI0035D00A1F